MILATAGLLAAIGAAASGVAQPSTNAATIAPAKAKALMHMRHERMETIRDNFRIVGRELDRGTPDLAKLATPAATIDRLARQASRWFPRGTGPEMGKTMAKPAIWQYPKDFAAKMAAFQKSAATLNGAVRAGNSGAAKAAAGEVYKTCKACHGLYREEH